MSKSVRISRGLNINLLGEADKVYASVKNHEIYALKPTDFHGLTPKLNVKIDDKVLAGSVVFYDKYNEKIKFCSPVSGTIKDIVRGEKRRILEVIIKADGKNKCNNLVICYRGRKDTNSNKSCSKEEQSNE